MPVIVTTLKNTHETVTRPIVLEVARYLFKLTGISENTELYYPDDLAKVLQPGSSINNNSAKLIFNHSERLTIEVDENYEQDKLLSTAVDSKENIFIFRDNQIRVTMKPVYSSADMTINFKYRATDRQAATRWRDNMRKHVSMLREINLHHLTYSYLVPEECIVLLQEIHRLRENVSGYNENFEVYFKKCMTPKLTTLANMSGTQEAYAIAETQMRVQGYFDFDGTPEKGEREDDGDSWTVNVSYKFKYDKPIGCVTRYPLMVHNQELNGIYLPTRVDTNEKWLRSYSNSGLNLLEFETGINNYSRPNGYSIPVHDDFQPTALVPSTMRVFTALTSIDNDFPSHFFSMLELGDIQLKPEIISFLRTEYSYINKPYFSVFNISCFCMNVLLPYDTVYSDSDLDIHSTFLRNPRMYYHVNFSIFTDLSLLTRDAKDRLKNNAAALFAILDVIAPHIRQNNMLPNVNGAGGITTAALNKIIDIINGAIPVNTHGTYGLPKDPSRPDRYDQLDRFKIQHNTVESLFVEAYRR